MILLDTDQLKQLASAAASATEELESASRLLEQITTHADWGCKERETINDYISGNRKKMLVLLEDSRSFTGIIGQIAEQFVTEENSIIHLFDHLEDILGNILSIPPGLVDIGSGLAAGNNNWYDDVRDTSSGIFDAIREIARGERRDWLVSSTAPIKVTAYNDILAGLEEK